jgi:hypothetical protein
MSYDGCDVKRGRWYLCAVCIRCQEPIPLMQVLPTAPPGEESVVFRGVSCPRCGATHNYRLGQAIRLRAAGQASGHST